MMKRDGRKYAKSVIGQSLDEFIKNILQFLFEEGNFKDGIKGAWSKYTQGGGWVTSIISGVGQGVMKTYDPLTITRNENLKAMKEYFNKNKSLKGFEYPLQPHNWLENLYHKQMKGSYSVSTFSNYTVPRWYYPQLYSTNSTGNK